MAIKIIKGIAIALVTIIICLILFVWWLLSDDIKLAKNYAEVEVAQGDIVDYKVFLNPGEKYDILSLIDKPIRDEIAEYMKINCLKLAEGVHSFNRVSGTVKSLINEDFRFEKISEEDNVNYFYSAWWYVTHLVF